MLPFVDYYIYATGEAPAADGPAQGETASPDVAVPPDEAETASAPAFPIPNTWRTNLPNNHLSYAITWFALAAALLVVYLVHHVRQASSTDVDGGD